MKKYRVNVNGISYEIEIEEITDSEAKAPVPVVEEKKAPVVEEKKASTEEVKISDNSVNAPLPGNILKVNVKPGDKVNKGQVLMILEAMKMENEILAPENGTVSSVQVNVGDQVNTGSVLCVLA